MIIEQTKSNNSALYTLITVFSLGFIGASNGIFIPFVKLNLRSISKSTDFAFMVPIILAQFYFYI
jgi:FHS family L-fucose permease-like MFS transporter